MELAAGASERDLFGVMSMLALEEVVGVGVVVTSTPSILGLAFAEERLALAPLDFLPLAAVDMLKTTTFTLPLVLPAWLLCADWSLGVDWCSGGWSFLGRFELRT